MWCKGLTMSCDLGRQFNSELQEIDGSLLCVLSFSSKAAKHASILSTRLDKTMNLSNLGLILLPIFCRIIRMG